MNKLQNPANPPKSREEAMTFLKSGLTEFDSANKEFLAAAPNDPRRWQVKLLEAQRICRFVARSRLNGRDR